MQANEKNLIKDLKTEGKKDLAFHILVKTYQERLYWHIRKIVIIHEDADDALQNTFVKVWKNINSFREDSSLFTWLYRIATNEALSLLQHRKKKAFLPINDTSEHLAGTLKSDEYFSGDEIQVKLQQAILKLPDKQRVVFNMKYFDNIKYEDMAAALDTSIGALKASYHHAVKKIEKYLNEV